MSRIIDATELNGYKFGLISPYAQKLFHETINNAPTVQAISLDKVKKAREELYEVAHADADAYDMVIDLDDALSILDKLIKEGEGNNEN